MGISPQTRLERQEGANMDEKRAAALKKVEKRRELREKVGNMSYSDLISVLAYLHKDAMAEMIMSCDIDEIERAIRKTQEGD